MHAYGKFIDPRRLGWGPGKGELQSCHVSYACYSVHVKHELHGEPRSLYISFATGGPAAVPGLCDKPSWPRHLTEGSH